MWCSRPRRVSQNMRAGWQPCCKLVSWCSPQLTRLREHTSSGKVSDAAGAALTPSILNVLRLPYNYIFVLG